MRGALACRASVLQLQEMSRDLLTCLPSSQISTQSSSFAPVCSPLYTNALLDCSSPASPPCVTSITQGAVEALALGA